MSFLSKNGLIKYDQKIKTLIKSILPTGLISGYVRTGQITGTEIGDYATSEGCDNKASGFASHAEGNGTTASGSNSHAEGTNTRAIEDNCHVEGEETTASGFASHAEGCCSEACGQDSHAEGDTTFAYGFASHSEGSSTTASGWYSHSEGQETYAIGDCQHVQGHYSKDYETGSKSGVSGTAFIIGNGASVSARSNAFRIDFNGVTYSKGAYNTSGADYAEYFEWFDGNSDDEDRRGYFVTLDGDKIKLASSGDYILGIISAKPVVVGNSDPDWHGRFLRDDFGDYIIREYTDDNGEHYTYYIENQDYNPETIYIPRSERREWAAVGMLGVLNVRDDGTCEVNGYCTCADNGIATASVTGYRVVGRVAENIIKVIFN